VSECDRGPHTVDLGPLGRSNNQTNFKEILSSYICTICYLYSNIFFIENRGQSLLVFKSIETNAKIINLLMMN
jgi:hypothetical protein